MCDRQRPALVNCMSINRRLFLQGSLLGAAGAATEPFTRLLGGNSERVFGSEPSQSEGLVVDTNVHLFRWPFRRLKYDTADALVGKLRQHGVKQAWAGSYEALFHKNVDAVNARLAEACNEQGGDLLIPFGTVNPNWPDWEEDLRRADEIYDMPGIRLYPGFQNYTLELPQFTELLHQAQERDLIVQIAIDQEDERMQHPRVEIPAVDVTPLAEALGEVPGLKMQLLNPFRHVRGERLRLMVEETDVIFGTSNLDGTGALERIMAGNHWFLSGVHIPSERLLLGSHMPFRPLENVLFQLLESELTEENASAIMAGNATTLINAQRFSS